MDRGTLISIISISVGIIIAVTPYFWRRFFARPELTIEIKNIHGSSYQEGISSKNDRSKGYIEGNDAIFIFRVKIECIIVIRNSSPHIAYYPKLIHDPRQVSFSRIDNFSSLKPILSAEEIELKCEYVKSEECKGVDRSVLTVLPPELENIKLLLEYKNALKTKAYTLYNNAAETKNVFLYAKPKEFKSVGDECVFV